ncbi:hypothetical protein [Rothia uropygioeca]|nr:hypothetical protein [Kocuria sp. 257]
MQVDTERNLDYVIDMTEEADPNGRKVTVLGADSHFSDRTSPSPTP